MTGRYVTRYGLQYSVIQPGAPWGLPLGEKVGRGAQGVTGPADWSLVAVRCARGSPTATNSAAAIRKTEEILMAVFASDAW